MIVTMCFIWDSWAAGGVRSERFGWIGNSDSYRSRGFLDHERQQQAKSHFGNYGALASEYAEEPGATMAYPEFQRKNFQAAGVQISS
jgi:hypothetical protein